MTSRLTKDLHPYLANAYQKACEEYHLLYPSEPKPFLTCTYRDNTDQNKLFAQGRTEKGNIVTNAKGGESLHNYYPSRAFDIAFVDNLGKVNWNMAQFKKFADIILEDERIEWGGLWRSIQDFPHFQFKGDSPKLAQINIDPLTIKIT